MKKLLAILLAILMVMSLAACGSEKTDDETDAPKTEDTTAAADADEGAQDVEEEEEELPTYEPALDVFKLLLVGDTTDIETVLPEEVWLAAAEGLDTTKEDAIDQLASSFEMLEGVFVACEYEVVSEEDASDKIEDIQEFLADYSLESEIEAAYELKLVWHIEMDEMYATEGEEEQEETAYAILVNGEWYILSDTYEWYALS